MTTLSARPNTALLVIDMQNGVVAGLHRRAEVVANIGALVESARGAGAPVVWIQDSGADTPRGSRAWEYIPELVREESETLVHKTYQDSFEDTDLEEALAAAGVGRVVVTGAHTDACVRSTIHGALVRGYDVTLVEDAHAAADLSSWGAPPPAQVIAHTNLYWRSQRAPGRVAEVTATKDVTFDR
ncbi:isochorismatase family protein [Occultella glacieicola]|uniref:Isochorismatase family protein n=1 Tax=Occultella glacieicola TaxID=2518684 RepID=A0ABY2ECT7_9MICO|nr:isochorismatase family protein [Occultella glacieicola]TDE98982.1 isochorismatase family protein [Occultella glacieicola]